MEKMKPKKIRQNIKIKPSFFIYVTAFLSLALFASVLTVHIVDKFVSTVSVFYIDANADIERINEDSDEDIRIAVSMLDKDFNEDDSDAILLYSRNWMVMALLVLYFIFAVFLSAQIFFKRKLNFPLKQLENAAQKISEKDLDFEIKYQGNDEMGKLCESFEAMRKQLVQNNTETWNIINEQKRVQHILAHDLRTPLTVTKGYTDILLEYIPQGKFSQEKILETIMCINRNIIRLENFINMMGDIENFDEIKIEKEAIKVESFFEELKVNAEAICSNKSLIFTSETDSKTAITDISVISQIATNLLSNANRYAKSEIKLNCVFSDNHFYLTVSDDGNGFSDEALKHALDTYFTEEKKSEGVHHGLGLAVCNTLCKKLGGSITLSNDNGAVVKVKI